MGSIKAIASICVALALGACATPDVAAPPAPRASDGTTTVVTAGGFGSLREADVRAFAQQLFGDAAELDAAEKAQAETAANDAVTAPDGARVAWRSDRHAGYAEARGQRYDKLVWHCHDTTVNATYRDHVPCRPADRTVSEADYWRLTTHDAVTPVASIAPAPARQPCRTIHEVTEVDVGHLTVVREHCLPLPSGP